jgi:hypothetical protein
MFIVMLRLIAQGCLGLIALALLLWHGFFGANWIAGLVPCALLCLLSGWVAPTPRELANWQEFRAQRQAEE